jgi:hypothetical protein
MDQNLSLPWAHRALSCIKLSHAPQSTVSTDLNPRVECRRVAAVVCHSIFVLRSRYQTGGTPVNWVVQVPMHNIFAPWPHELLDFPFVCPDYNHMVVSACSKVICVKPLPSLTGTRVHTSLHFSHFTNQ